MTISQKKKLAKNLFINTEMTRKAIADTVGITEKTLREWIEKYNWQAEKDSKRITRTHLLQDAYAQLAAVNEEIREQYNNVPNKQLSDAKGILIKEIEALDKNPLHKYIEACEEIVVWLSKDHPKKVIDISELLDEFIQKIAIR